MKKYIIVLLVCGAGLAVNSCDSSVLDLEPVTLTESAFYSSEQDMEEAVLGTYQKLIFFYNYRGNGWMHDLWLLPDDDATTTGGSSFENFVGINAGDGKVASFFRFIYQGLSRANTVLEKQMENPEAYTNENLRNAHRGEALFLRAYFNFLLWNYFETAPLVNDRIVNLDASRPGNSGGMELLDQAITDWTEAVDLLPAAWPDDQRGRVTADAARGMAAKALVFRATVSGNNADYTQAITLIDGISGRSLMANFGDNFDEAFENNEESLFEIQLGTNVANNVWLNNDDFSVVGDLGGYYGFFDNHWSLFGIPVFTATASLQAVFDPADPRIADTFDPATGNILKYVNRPRGSGNPDYWNNARIMRYADALLLKAEALVQTGGSLQEAIGLINQIRARARGAGVSPADRDVNETSAAVVMQWVMDERRMELAFEDGARWLDLRRWHKSGLIDLNNLDFSSVRADLDWEDRNIRLPIPETEILSNSNLTQNDGF